jgi:organic hydroperoxide reductase OsmC/OhrA
MRELRAPWTHFFDGDTSVKEPGVRGTDLVQDFLQAHGDEPYAGLQAIDFSHTVGFEMETLIPKPQPLLFDAPGIEAERWPYRDGSFVKSPLASPTWEAAYEAFKRGEQLALPYLEVRASDADKLASRSAAYREFRAGTRAELPDLADIFPDDAMLRARIGLNTEPGATPAQALVQACGSCHNDVLDQSLSRARFNIDLSRMDRAELELAIERMQRTGPGVMPPPEFRQLDAPAREALIAYLRTNEPGPEDAAFLKRAAQLGMAGGGGQ